MENKKSTILIIGYEEKGARSFNINNHFIKYYKRYVAALLSFLILFFAGLAALISHLDNVKSENKVLTADLTKIRNEVELIDSLKLEEKLVNIDQNLSQINNYLLSRGFISNTNAGGETDPNIRPGFALIGFFEEKSELFLNTLENIPLGYPYRGEMSSGYGYRSNPFGGYSGELHSGVDFKGNIGDPVYVTADGIVEKSEWYSGYGNAVVIYHTQGYQTLYGHLTRVNVEPGETVKAGNVIGFLGSTGRSTGPHVHYEIRKNGIDIDPAPFLRIY
jgi:murein DD-endopeptidase MepM/ murein hydrolase activator NlpD